MGVERGAFLWANPDVVVWGAGCAEERLDGELRRLGAGRVFLVTTRSVAAHPDLAEALRARLGQRLVGEYAGIGEHAPARMVAEAVAAARAAEPDCLLSFGGGSPVDAAKSVAYALATGLDLADPDAAARARDLSLAGKAVLPHVAIPTTLSAAEFSGLAGFTTEQGKEKMGLRAREITPSAVFLDARLTLPTPMRLWLSSGIRAVDHAAETLLAAGSHPFADTLAEEALRRLAAGLRATSADAGDLEARTQSQLGAWFSFTLPGPAASGLSHTLGKRLGSRHGIPHGVTSCLVLPHVLRYLEPRSGVAQRRIAAALGAPAGTSAADAVGALVAELGLPTHLAELGVGKADLAEAVRPVASAEYPADELVGVLRAAL